MAVYLPEHNALFIYAPHTGAESVVAALRDPLRIAVEQVGFEHSHKDLVGTLRRATEPVTFTLVRHPLAWYSDYWAAKRRQRSARRAPVYTEPERPWYPTWPFDRDFGDGDFAAFIRAATAEPDRLYELFRWYTGLGTHDVVDVIGKQETATADLRRFLDAVGVPPDPALPPAPLAPASGATDAGATWTPELRELVLAAEARFLTEYGYDEPGPWATG
jgi:hypothetical protein